MLSLGNLQQYSKSPLETDLIKVLSKKTKSTIRVFIAITVKTNLSYNDTYAVRIRLRGRGAK